MIEQVGLSVVIIPAALLALLGLPSLVARPLSEAVTGRLVQLACVLGLAAALAVLGWMLLVGNRGMPVEVGHWVQVPHFQFSLKFVFDRLSVPFVILSFLLCGTIGAFANRYLHREPGFHRFFVLFAVFLLGMVVTSLAGTIETLFLGWELVGLSSALLIAFFHERVSPVRNGLQVWAVYRVSDAALLIAAVMLHHLNSHGDFAALFGDAAAWPAGQASVSPQTALIVGLLLLLAAAGKSAMVPFSGWLPRAMEGPTPSSAVFYGALSVHLGAFLLLRVSPLLELSLPLRIAVISVGLATAIFAAISSSVQTDIKSALSLASLTQVGLIVVEIGFGLHYLALAHIIGHASLRTLQFLRAGSVLQDLRMHENALGQSLAGDRNSLPWLSDSMRLRWYRFGLERGYLDDYLAVAIAQPLLTLFRTCDALERRWTDFLAGGQSRESDRLTSAASSLEDLT